jgi:hypothetical protein
MQVDRHQPICHIIDKSLVGGTSPQEEQALREHLLACAPCKEYLNDCNRAIAGLEGFSFEVNPALHGRVIESLTRRAQQLETKRIDHRQIVWNCLTALLLTVAGSFAASQFGALVAAVFHFKYAPVQFGLIAFWIVPSLCFCLLLPILMLLSSGWMNEKGLSL